MGRESRGERARRQLKDLRASGFSDAEIANSLGLNRSTVFRTRTGRTEPAKGGYGRRLTFLYNRVNRNVGLTLGEGGIVNLTGLFRRIWVQGGDIQTPLNLDPVPNYQFPNNAPVWVNAYFSEWRLNNGENYSTKYEEKSLKCELTQGQDIPTSLESCLSDAMSRIEGSRNNDIKLDKAVMSAVLLKRGA